jgi:hypothetical protein
MSDKWYTIFGVPYGHRWPSICVCCEKPADSYIEKTLIFSCVDSLLYKEWKTLKTKIPYCNGCKIKAFWQRRKDHHCFGYRAVKIKESPPSFNIFFRNHSVGNIFKELNGILEACPKCGSKDTNFFMPKHQRTDKCKDCGHVWLSGGSVSFK